MNLTIQDMMRCANLPVPMDPIDEWLTFALSKWGMDLDSVDCFFTTRMRTTGGYAYYKSGKIKLSPGVWERATLAQRREIVIHEVCHIISYRVFGKAGRGHNTHWRACMMMCGYPNASRCHKVDVSDLRNGRRSA